MAYPTDLDNFTDPTALDRLSTASVLHSTQHSQLNTAVEALEAKLGANSSAVTTSHDYKLGGVTGSDKAASLTGTETFTNKKLSDSTTTIVDASDPTKAIKFDVAGTAGVTGTLASAFTTAKVLTLPDATDTLVGRDTTDTLTAKTLTAPKFANGGFIADANGNELLIFNTTAAAVNEWTLANGSTGVNPKLSASGETNVGLDFQVKGTGVYRFLATASGPTDIRLFEDTDNGSNYVSLLAPASMASDRVLTLPDATDTLVGKATTDVMTNKTLTSPQIGGSTGGITVNNGRARAYASSNQTGVATGTFTKVTLGTETYDLGSNFATSTYTAPVTGYYSVSGVITYLDSTVVINKRFQVAIYKNGSGVARCIAHTSVANYCASSVHDVIALTAGDTIELYTYHEFGANATIYGDSSFTYLTVNPV